MKNRFLIFIICALLFSCNNVYAVSLKEIYNISDNQEELDNIMTVEITSNDGTDAEIHQMLPVIAKCNHINYIYFSSSKTMSIDNKTFFDYIVSDNEVTVSLQSMNIDFQGINNTNITTIYLAFNDVTNFKDIEHLSNLKTLYIESIDGFEVVNFNNLEALSFIGMFSDDYKKLFDSAKNIKTLDLTGSNFSNYDMPYLKKIKNLEGLQLAGTRVTDITELTKCPKLRMVGLPYDVDNINLVKELNNLGTIEFDAVTELKITNALLTYFEENNILYPKDFDRNMSNKINDVITSLGITDDMSDFDKVKKVTEYIHLNYVGNSDILNAYHFTEHGNEHMTSLDEIVNSGAGVCHWYSILGYTLLRLVDVDVYYVRGYGLHSDLKPGAHSWNVVKIDDTYYGLDLLWSDTDLQTPLEKSLYYLKPTVIDSYDYWPFYGDEVDFLDKYFAQYHRAVSNPIRDSEIVRYTVTFDSTGGSNVESQIISNNGIADEPSNPTKTGYTFRRWLLNGIEYNFNIPVTSNIKLIAEWEIIEVPSVVTLKDILEDKGYSISNNYVLNFTLGESISSIISRIGNNVVIDTNNLIISTGTIIRKDNESYQAVIKGDLTGDGKINSGDLLQMRKYLLEEVNLTGAYKQAGMIESYNNIKSLDLLRLRQYLLGEYNFKY